MKRFYGRGLPKVAPKDLMGKLIVLEGADGSGRSTQADLLTAWLERKGYATVNVGLNRSTLVSRELGEAKQGNVLTRTTLTLFYATDFADQLENRIIPALKAGFVVLADRYIYTLIARDMVRGGNRPWLESLYGIAIVPDIVFYLQVSPRQLIERNFQKHASLDHWESGMDLGLSRDMFQSFLKYQGLIQAEFERMQKAYGFDIINGNRSIRAIAKDLQARVEPILGRSAA
ncbi:MAG: thymidylate kinase [Candidatus Latescibacteria bacterium]|nr:thymidylate kinase [Candidatus Latescibacterota bacterium]